MRVERDMQTALSNRVVKRASGFTLVELLIVVIILAILAAIVVPQFATSTDDAKEAALDSTLANMRDVIDLYFAQHGEYPAALGDGTNAADTEGAFISQLSRYTDSDGAPQDTKDTAHPYGPYLKTAQVPKEPMTNSRVISIISTGSLAMVADGTTGGWKFDSKSGKLIVNHTTWQGR